MKNWQKLEYYGQQYVPFYIRLDYCDEDVAVRDMYCFVDDDEWIAKTEKKIQDGYGYWVIIRARVYLAGIEVGSHSLGGLLFDNIEQMEGMMKNDYEGIIDKAVDIAKYNLKQMSETMNAKAQYERT